MPKIHLMRDERWRKNSSGVFLCIRRLSLIFYYSHLCKQTNHRSKTLRNLRSFLLHLVIFVPLFFFLFSFPFQFFFPTPSDVPPLYATRRCSQTFPLWKSNRLIRTAVQKGGESMEKNNNTFPHRWKKKTQCLFLKISRGTVRNHTSHQGFQPGSAGAFQHRGAVRCPGAEPLQLLLLLLLLMMLQEEEVDEKDSLIVFTRKITDPHFHLNPTYSRFLLCSLMSSPFFNMRRKRSW